MAKRYLIETFGCQMNIHDSERMAGLLEQAGYESTADDRDADVIVINTCSVREKAEEKLFTRLGEIHHQGLESGERPIVAVAGCVAQQEGDQILRRSAAVDVIVGTQNIKRLPMLVDGAVRERESGSASRASAGPGSARRRVVPARHREADGPATRPTSRSSKAATSSAHSAWCPTPAARSGCGRSVTSSPRRGMRPRRAQRKFSCSGRS